MIQMTLARIVKVSKFTAIDTIKAGADLAQNLTGFYQT